MKKYLVFLLAALLTIGCYDYVITKMKVNAMQRGPYKFEISMPDKRGYQRSRITTPIGDIFTTPWQQICVKRRLDT